MPEPKQSSSNVGANGVAWLLLAAAGTYFVVHTAPLEGSRPPTTEAFLREQPSPQDIESRLWRDPFAAVAERLAKSTDLRPENCKDEKKKEGIRVHCMSPLSELPNRAPIRPVGANKPSNPLPPIVIVASVSGAPYSEGHEWRRRQRYAIVAGLERQKFVPSDPEHLGFFWPRVNDPQARSPEVVPFEWFDGQGDNGSVLLLWFDEDVLGGSPLREFDEFLCRTLRAKVPSSIRWSKALVLGPDTSTTLKAMASEVDGEQRSKRRSDGCREKERAEFYVSGATAADSEFGEKEQDCPDTSDRLSEHFKDRDENKNVTLYRMTATDAALACLMRDELALREPHRMSDLKLHLPPALAAFFSYVKGKMPESLRQALGLIDESEENHIVLISEWDTFYGQALPKAMANCLGPIKTPATKCNELAKKSIHRYSYLRGLDGQTPKLEEPNSGDAAKASDKNQDANDNQDKSSKEQTKTWPNTKPNDRAEGQGQFDYLRRMGEEIASIDAHLRSGVDEKPENRSRNGIFAVGVLGSDRYDKLLILQALRPLLPNARFFTTDLDASALHPTALPYTRNLLIASSFALQLNDKVQQEIPPFRSSYQTAAFFATQVAIRAAIEDMAKTPAGGDAKGGTAGDDRQTCIWKKPPPPLLFEVGLSTLFQIPSAKSGNDSKNRDESDPLCEPRDLRAIHPTVSGMFPQPGRGAPLAVAMAIVGLGFGVTLTCRFMRRKIWLALDGHLARPNGGKALFVLGGGVLLSVCLLVIALAWAIVSWWPPIAGSLTDAGQPMLWLEGISIWPTIVMRTAILALCVVLLLHSRRWLNDDFWELAGEMKMKEAWRRVISVEDAIAARKSPWTKLVSCFNSRLSAEDRSAYADKSLPSYLLRFWGPQIYQSRRMARIFRVSTYVVILFVLWGIFELVFGNPPIPTRGVWAFRLYTPVSLLLHVAALFLTLFVADATFQCWRLVEALREETDKTFEDANPKATPTGTVVRTAAAATQAEVGSDATAAPPPGHQPAGPNPPTARDRASGRRRR
jgi:hypothetical protein